MDTRGLKGVRNGKEERRFYIGQSYLLETVVKWLTDRLITLNALKASDEITEDQSRQVRPVPTCPVSGSMAN